MRDAAGADRGNAALDTEQHPRYHDFTQTRASCEAPPGANFGGYSQRLRLNSAKVTAIEPTISPSENRKLP